MDVRGIRIETLEKMSGIGIQKWIADANPDDEPVEIVSQREVVIGDCELSPIKWKCESCGRWNFVLAYMDPIDSIAVCEYCSADHYL